MARSSADLPLRSSPYLGGRAVLSYPMENLRSFQVLFICNIDLHNSESPCNYMIFVTSVEFLNAPHSRVIVLVSQTGYHLLTRFHHSNWELHSVQWFPTEEASFQWKRLLFQIHRAKSVGKELRFYKSYHFLETLKTSWLYMKQSSESQKDHTDIICKDCLGLGLSPSLSSEQWVSLDINSRSVTSSQIMSGWVVNALPSPASYMIAWHKVGSS